MSNARFSSWRQWRMSARQPRCEIGNPRCLWTVFYSFNSSLLKKKQKWRYLEVYLGSEPLFRCPPNFWRSPSSGIQFFAKKNIFKNGAHSAATRRTRAGYTLKKQRKRLGNNRFTPKTQKVEYIFEKKWICSSILWWPTTPPTFWPDPILRFLKNDLCSRKEAITQYRRLSHMQIISKNKYAHVYYLPVGILWRE